MNQSRLSSNIAQMTVGVPIAGQIRLSNREKARLAGVSERQWYRLQKSEDATYRRVSAIVAKLICNTGSKRLLETDWPAFLELFIIEFVQQLESDKARKIHRLDHKWAKGGAHRMLELLVEASERDGKLIDKWAGLTDL